MAQATLLPSPTPEVPLKVERDGADDEEIVQVLEGYRKEAKTNREGGLNPRDEKWTENLDLYWNRFDFSDKADWQAKETMPEVPSFVDRFAAALKEALVSSPNGFYDVVDPGDREHALGEAIENITDVWLSRCGRNQNGHILDFGSVFEDQVKLGALMACSSVVLWKGDTKSGRVAIETVDPRQVYLDHTYRDLYRIRRIEIDKHELANMVRQKDSGGDPIFKLPEMERLVAEVFQQSDIERQDLTGVGIEQTSTRETVTLDEYIATVVTNDGRVVADKALMVVANEKFLIRGPEANPFWHKKDWLLFAPLVHAPLSVYGRTYMEDFGSVAKTFNELTNMILDAVHTSSLKAFAMAPGLLLNPGQVAEGISPNKIFQLEEGVRPNDFMKEIELGSLPPESVQVWQAIKNELREAADINEVGLGQFAPKSRTPATETVLAQQNSSALVRSIAQTVESHYLNPTLDLVWKTGLQHASPDDQMLSRAAGPEMYAALIGQRRELARRELTFQARGISTLIQKGRLLRSLMQVLQVMSANELLLAEFLKIADLKKLVKLLFELSDIDLSKLELSQQDRLIRSVAQPLQQAGDQAAANTQGQSAGPQTRSDAQEIASSLGVTRGG